jgi:hypothetical protein
MKSIHPLNILLLLILVSCSSTPAPATDVPSPVTPILPTETPLPTPAPTITPVPTSQFRAFRSANCCKAREIESGKYELPAWLDLPLTIEVGEGWGVLNEKAALLFLLSGKGRNEFNDPGQVLVFISVPGGDPQALLTSIRNSPELVPATEITETTIAGFSGWQFDAVATPNPGNKGSEANSIPAGSQKLPALNKYFAPGFLWTTWTAEPRLRFIALDMGEQILLLQIESPSAEFDTFASEADQVLQSLKMRN